MGERDIPGLGSEGEIPRRIADADTQGLKLEPHDWFLLSRVDGEVSLRELFLLSAVGREETIASLRRLRDAGLLTLPGAASQGGGQAQGTQRGATRGGGASTAAGGYEAPRDWPRPWATFEFDARLMALDVPLDEAYRRQVLYVHANLEHVDHYALLGLARDAARRDVRRRYLQMSKAFHPDRFFRKALGPFQEMIDAIFRRSNEAYQTLNDRRERAAYDAALAQPVQAPGARATGGEAARARARPLSQLLGEAKRRERGGDYDGAFTLYEEALGQRRSAELMNRSAECLIRLRRDLALAETRAQGAVSLEPRQARYHVALAYVHELRGQSEAARRSYEAALRLDPGHAGARARLERLNVGRG